MNATFTKTCFFLMLLFLSAATLEAQKQSPLDIALRHLEQARESWQLTAADIADVTVSDQYQTRHNGVTHLYFMQRYAGIPLYNAINGIHITRDGKVAFATNRFVPDLASRANATNPALTAYQAIEAAATHLELIMDGPLRLLQQTSAQELAFEAATSPSPHQSQADVPTDCRPARTPGLGPGHRHAQQRRLLELAHRCPRRQGARPKQLDGSLQLRRAAPPPGRA
jgi:hypothetical protein